MRLISVEGLTFDSFLPLFSENALKIRMILITNTDPQAQAVEGEEPQALYPALGEEVFPVEIRHWIEAEWLAAWQKSLEAEPEGIRLATDDEEIRKRMEEQAGRINAKDNGKGEVRVRPPAGKRADAPPARTLKTRVGRISGATIQGWQATMQGEQATVRGKTKLKDKEPIPRPRSDGPPPATTAYTNAELEQHAWAILTHVLNDSEYPSLVDFRNRHGVGADGAIDWKTFVELKATGREPKSSIELPISEYDRALERGTDYILALVSGLEDGLRDEIRLIFDPARQATVRPVGSVRLTGLLEAPSIVIHFDEPQSEGKPAAGE